MMLPRWKDVVPAISKGRVTRSAEPATVKAAISAAKTIFRVVRVCFFSMVNYLPNWYGNSIASSGYKYSAKSTI